MEQNHRSNKSILRLSSLLTLVLLGLIYAYSVHAQEPRFIREPIVVELRKMLNRLVTEVSNELPNASDLRDITIIVERNFTKELINELISKIPSNKGTLLNLGLNLLPYNVGSIAGGLKDVINLVIDKRSWVSLLQ